VLLRDKQGNEDKRRPGIEVSSPVSVSSAFFPVPVKLNPLERLDFSFKLLNLQIQPLDITEFEAIDTLNRALRYKFPRKLRREIEAWVKEENSSPAGRS
jgi:hypothetical protein